MNRAELPERFSAAATSRLIWWGTLMLLLYSVWVWAGLRPSFHRFALYGSLPLAALLMLGGPGATRRAIWRDAVFWLGLLFNGYLLLQWSNAGRELYLDPALNQWLYSDPPRPGWPYAFNAAEAWQMITWFFPAWIIVCAIRSPHFTLAASRRLLLALVFSAGLLGLFGLVQLFSGTPNVYGVTPFSAGFYASFTYRNHAGSFFTLMALTGAALFYRAMFGHHASPSWWSLLLLVLAVCLCLMSLVFCGSRAAVFFFGLCVMVILGSGFRLMWRLSGKAQKLHAITVTLLLVTVFGAIIHVYGRDVLRKEFAPPRRAIAENDSWLQARGINLNMSPAVRILLAQAAWDLWQDHAWLGVGGWGYKYKMAFYIPEEQWGEIRKSGRANVHVDGLQYLAEFGVVGFSFMIIPLGLMVLAAASRSRKHKTPGVHLVFLGLGLVVLHSFIDIPFRSPGVLYHWLAVLVLVPAFIEENHRLNLDSKK